MSQADAHGIRHDCGVTIVTIGCTMPLWLERHSYDTEGVSMAAWGADARYTRLVERHATTLLHLAMLLTGNRFDAEDVVQDVLISVAAKWRVSEPTSTLAYLKRAVANRSIDVIRKRREIPTEHFPDSLVEERGFLRHEDDERFFELVRALPDRQRATVILRYSADLDDHTIAKLLGVSVETVRSQAKHALTKLRAEHAVGKDQP